MINPEIKHGIWYDLYRVRTALMDLGDAFWEAELRLSDRVVRWALSHGSKSAGPFRTPTEDPLGAPGGTQGAIVPILDAEL